MSRAGNRFLMGCMALIAGCGGAGASGSAPAPAPAPAPAENPVPAAAPAAPTPAEISAQVRTARSACSGEATKQGLELIDFVTFNRLDDSNWDSTIRVRRKGRLVRIGCRYDLKVASTYIYEPSSADGGNPWGAAGPPKPAGGAAGSTTGVAGNGGPAPAAAETKVESRSVPPKGGAKPEPRPEPPRAKPLPGSDINLNAIADTAARAAIVRTRDACLAEAARRRIAFDDFDAFRRVNATRWEAMLLIRNGKGSSRGCQVDLTSGKATIK